MFQILFQVTPPTAHSAVAPLSRSGASPAGLARAVVHQRQGLQLLQARLQETGMMPPAEMGAEVLEPVLS